MFLMPMSAVGFGAYSAVTDYQPPAAVFTDGNDYLTKTNYSSSGSSDKVMSCGGWFKIIEVADDPTTMFCWTRSNNANDYVRMQLYDNTGQIRLVLQNTSDTAVSYTHLTLPTTPYV